MRMSVLAYVWHCLSGLDESLPSLPESHKDSKEVLRATAMVPDEGCCRGRRTSNLNLKWRRMEKPLAERKWLAYRRRTSHSSHGAPKAEVVIKQPPCFLI